MLLALIRVKWFDSSVLNRFTDDPRRGGAVLFFDAEPFSQAGVRHRVSFDVPKTGMKVARPNAIGTIHVVERLVGEKDRASAAFWRLENRCGQLIKLGLKYNLVHAASTPLPRSSQIPARRINDAKASLRERGGESRNRSVFTKGRPGFVISIRSLKTSIIGPLPVTEKS